MSIDPLRRNEAELTAIRAQIAEERDGPMLMLNLNTYTPAAGFPDGAGYRAYMAALEALLGEAGARVLWRYPVEGQMVGASEDTQEVLGIWYPSGEAFLDLPNRPGAGESYRLRSACVSRATIHRCSAGPDALETNRALVRAFLASVAHGELPDELLTDDMTGWITTGGTMSKAAYQNVVAILARMLAAPLQFTIDAITVEDDRALAEVRSTGTLIDGTPYANTYVFAFRFADGRIRGVAEHFNPLITQDTLLPLMRKSGLMAH